MIIGGRRISTREINVEIDVVHMDVVANSKLREHLRKNCTVHTIEETQNITLWNPQFDIDGKMTVNPDALFSVGQVGQEPSKYAAFGQMMRDEGGGQ